jgi:hypothetical protein
MITNFRRTLPVFGEKIGVLFKTDVINNFWNTEVEFFDKKAHFFRHFFKNIVEITITTFQEKNRNFFKKILSKYHPKKPQTKMCPVTN